MHKILSILLVVALVFSGCTSSTEETNDNPQANVSDKSLDDSDQELAALDAEISELELELDDSIFEDEELLLLDESTFE